VMAERPELYFHALVRLTEVLHRRLPEPPGLIGASIVRTYCSGRRSWQEKRSRSSGDPFDAGIKRCPLRVCR
jgi:hypothetical protein